MKNLTCFVDAAKDQTIEIVALTQSAFENWLKQQDSFTQNWLQQVNFKIKSAAVCLVPKANGQLQQVILGLADENDFWAFGILPKVLPEGIYRLAESIHSAILSLAYLAFGLGYYQFTAYKKLPPYSAQLILPTAFAFTKQLVKAIYWVRDLINTPAEDMMPEHVAIAANQLAKEFNAEIKQIVGDELLAKNYPLIYAVGKGSMHAPRLIELRFGNPSHPKVSLVGKGVCFDSGGLDIKSASGMALMRKDMAGSAHALGLAYLIMAAKLPVYLRVLIPAVENAVSGSSYHPGDILATRKGLSVEVTNTDAEGRLVLADALASACEEKPDVIVDFATLTGAARVAVGVELAAMFCNQLQLTQSILEISQSVRDPIWPLPLYQPYQELLESPFADVCNSSSSPYGGAITAALFLQRFVDTNIPWLHFDMMAWNEKEKPGRPQGGEVMVLRAMFEYLQQQYGKKS